MRSLKRLFYIGTFDIVDPVMQCSSQIHMIIILPEPVNDLIIQWTSHQPYLMSVLKKRKCEGGRHLSCSN